MDEKIQTDVRCIDTNAGEKNSEDTRVTWCTLNHENQEESKTEQILILDISFIWASIESQTGDEWIRRETKWK